MDSFARTCKDQASEFVPSPGAADGSRLLSLEDVFAIVAWREAIVNVIISLYLYPVRSASFAVDSQLAGVSRRRIRMMNVKVLILTVAAAGLGLGASGCLVPESDLAQCQAELDESKDYAATLRAQIAQTKTAHSKELTALNDQLQVARTHVSEANEQIAALTKKREDAVSELKAARVKTESLSDQLAHRDKQLTQLRSEVSRAQEKVLDLELQVKTLQADLPKPKQPTAAPAASTAPK